jgi:hypothetical protein
LTPETGRSTAGRGFLSRDEQRCSSLFNAMAEEMRRAD